MRSFEHAMTKAVEDGVILGAVAAVKDKTGKVDYVGTFGSRTVKPEKLPMRRDTTFQIASMTKLMTTIAALQLVERGLVRLDDDVTGLLPALAKLEILVGFADDGETPIMKKRRNPITLRQLLTHSFGGGYSFNGVELSKWLQYHKLSLRDWGNRATVDELFGYPLLSEPGESWCYGSGLDWAGQLVEVLTGLPLEEYMKQHIWKPLGFRDVTFWPDERADFSARLASMSIRDAKLGKASQSRKPIRIAPGAKQACGGQGAFATMVDYVEILHSILRDDERLLKKETTATMFRGNLSAASKAALRARMESPDWAIGYFPNTGEYDWGLGGLLIDGDKDPYRKRNTMIWSGNANLYWFIDREAGVCAAFGCQLLPPADAQCRDLIVALEKGAHEQVEPKAQL